MLFLSSIIGIVSAGLGHLMALTVPGWFGFKDTNTSGMMAVAVGLMFFAALVLSPRYGLLGKMLSVRRIEVDEAEVESEGEEVPKVI
jgi:manganese/zinc/iron transport system permease protein